MGPKSENFCAKLRERINLIRKIAEQLQQEELDAKKNNVNETSQLRHERAVLGTKFSHPAADKIQFGCLNSFF